MKLSESQFPAIHLRSVLALAMLWLAPAFGRDVHEIDPCAWNVAQLAPRPSALLSVRVMVNKEHPADPEQVREVADLVHDLADFYARDLELPSHATVYLDRVHSHPFADSHAQLVRVPYQYSTQVDLKTPAESRAVVVHEMGHLLTDWTLEKRYPEALGEIRMSVREGLEQRINEALENEKRILAQLQLLEKTPGTPQVVLDEVDAAFEANYGRLGDLRNQAVELDRKYHQLKSYCELLGDAVTVGFFYDGKVMRKAVEYPGMSRRMSQRVEARDFTIPHDVGTWFRTQEHEVAGPARHHLWARYFSNPKYREKIPEIVSRLIDAVGSELIQRQAEHFKNLEGDEWNERMIRAIDRAMIGL